MGPPRKNGNTFLIVEFYWRRHVNWSDDASATQNPLGNILQRVHLHNRMMYRTAPFSSQILTHRETRRGGESEKWNKKQIAKKMCRITRRRRKSRRATRTTLQLLQRKTSKRRRAKIYLKRRRPKGRK